MAWGETAIDYMASKGREPSFGHNGQLRGFKSRAGAAPANTYTNRGAVGPTPTSLTNTGNWNDIFYNRLTHSNPLAKAATTPTTGVPHVDAALSEITGANWGSNNDFNANGGAPDGIGIPLPPTRKPTAPNLTTMLNPTHAAAWGANELQQTLNPLASKGYETGIPSLISDRYGPKAEPDQYAGWGGG